jgi:SAM-dependent methyltransferase
MSHPLTDVIAARTLGHYSANAREFWEGTRDHDVSQNRDALLGALGNRKALRLLDFGCGPGRDVIAFAELGHAVTGLDGCAEFVAMAREVSGCEVLHQNFFDLALGSERFDGVFANASLQHVPSALLPRVLAEIFDSLVPRGVLFCSVPRAFEANEEGFSGERYSCFLTIESWTRAIGEAGFVLERQYLRPPENPPERQPWLAMVWRKP